MPVEATLPNGLVVGLERPLVLLALPVGVALLWALVYRGAAGVAGPSSRRRLFAVRVVLVVLLVGAAVGPYTVATRESRGDPEVTLLVDESDSMAVNRNVDGLEAAIEEEGVPVTTATVGEGTRSRVGDGIVANLRENGSLVVVSDGQVTEGRSLSEAAETARELNATVSTVAVPTERTERHVAISGPSKTSVGVENTFLVSVGGARTDGTATVTVRVDGEEVTTEEVSGSDAVEFSHSFEDVGSHRVTAQIESDDVYEQNDVFYKSVRAVEKPRILYVSKGEYPLREYLADLYRVDTAESVPDDLEPYTAVVMQDVPAGGVGNLDALQSFVIDGNGLLVVGGRNSFENGGYEDSAVGSMLPVTVGETSPGSTKIVLAIDVSGSAQEGMRAQKAIALSVLNQLGDRNEVGIVGFNQRAYRVADVSPLSTDRARLEDRIRRLQAGGATDIAGGLRGSEDLLDGQSGTVILISDGGDRPEDAAVVANQLGRDGVRVISVGVGPATNENTMSRIADAAGGSYYRADETDRLRLLFGGSSRRFSGEGLTVVDRNSFVTAGVELTANPSRANDVSVRPGAEYLVATADGTPAVATWRYGLGRVVTLTAYGEDGTLDGLLQRPDSLLLTKSTNYVIGDPQRKETGVTDVADTRVGVPTTVTYRGEERPQTDQASFSAVSPGVYRAEVTPDRAGFDGVLGATYAANYRTEYAAFGTNPELGRLVETTGGRQFSPDQAAAIAEFARQSAVQVRDVETRWDWVLLTLALLLYLVEVVYRRLQVYWGRTRLESGLQ
jgi:Mg-chelatase subunit ChlD